MDGSNPSGLISIAIALIGGAFAVWSAYVSKNTKKSTKTIKDVLSNTKTPISSLDQAITILQRELQNTSIRHEQEMKYMEGRVTEQSRALGASEEARERLQREVDRLGELLRRHGIQIQAVAEATQDLQNHV